MDFTVTNVESTILSRVIDPDDASFSPAAARALLTLRFKEWDLQRMHELAEKAREGEMTTDEREEIEGYERIVSFLGLLQSKARLVPGGDGR